MLTLAEYNTQLEGKISTGYPGGREERPHLESTETILKYIGKWIGTLKSDPTLMMHPTVREVIQEMKALASGGLH